MIYGYARVSTKSQEDNTSLQSQNTMLKANGAGQIFEDIATGSSFEREGFQTMEKLLNKGDTLLVTKLDRFSRSTESGVNKVRELSEKGIKVHILNMGIVDASTPNGKLMLNILLSFAEYERDCIVERMKDGKAMAKQNPNFREGRPKKYSKEKLDHAIDLLNNNSYKRVEEMTGISKSTLIRARREKILL